MEFTRDMTEHPDEIRKNIYKAALYLTPIETSLMHMHADSFSPALKKSCRAYHAFILSMLCDMYQSPEKYGFRPGKLEEFLAGKKINYYKRSAASKLEPLLVEARDAVYSYYRFLYELARRGKISKDTMILSPDEYYEIQLQFDKNLAAKNKKNKNFLIPFDVRVDALSRVGFTITKQTDNVIISSLQFPDMFHAMHELALSAPKIKVFGEQGFFNCEFRQIHQTYLPGFDDIIQPLPEERKKIAMQFHQLALENKMKPSYTTFWKANYKYKGKQVMQLLINANTFRVLITGTGDDQEREMMNTLLAAQDSDFQKYVMHYLHYCLGCSNTHLGSFIEVLGRKVRVCSTAIRLVKTNPELADIPYFSKFIQLRKHIIDTGKH